MSKESKTTLRYRDTTTGRLLPDRIGQIMPKPLVVRERMPKPGHGDTGRKK